MYGKLLLVLLCLNTYRCTFNPKFILKYEYGKRVPGDHLAYHTTSEIPKLTPYWTYYVNTSKIDTSFEKQFTHLIVEYVSPMSDIDIKYDPNKTTLNFYVRIPFLPISFGVAGYAMKRRKQARRYGCKY